MIQQLVSEWNVSKKRNSPARSDLFSIDKSSQALNEAMHIMVTHHNSRLNRYNTQDSVDVRALNAVSHTNMCVNSIKINQTNIKNKRFLSSADFAKYRYL